MPEVPDDFVTDATIGHINPDEVFDYIEESGNAELGAYIAEAVENGLSLEWALIGADMGVSPDIESWDHVTIHRDPDGDWAVTIMGGDGEAHTVNFTDEDAAQDLIWADLYFHMQDYGVEFDKDIDSVGTGE